MGYWMTAALALLIAGLWLRNAWPEWQLRGMARQLEVPLPAPSDSFIPDLLEIVADGIEERYASLFQVVCSLALRLDREVMGEDARYIVWLVDQTPSEGVSEENLDRLEGICWEMEDCAQNPWEHAQEAAAVATEVHRLRKMRRRHKRLRADLMEKAPA